MVRFTRESVKFRNSRGLTIHNNGMIGSLYVFHIEKFEEQII